MVVHSRDKDEVLRCACGWSCTWGDYHRSYQHKQLVGGGAYPLFRGFIEGWPQARTPRDKMLTIDALIHAFHGEFKGNAGRPAGCNVIEGTMLEIVVLIDDLAYGDGSTPGVADRGREWNDATHAGWWRHIRRKEARRPND